MRETLTAQVKEDPAANLDIGRISKCLYRASLVRQRVGPLLVRGEILGNEVSESRNSVPERVKGAQGH